MVTDHQKKDHLDCGLYVARYLNVLLDMIAEKLQTLAKFLNEAEIAIMDNSPSELSTQQHQLNMIESSAPPHSNIIKASAPPPSSDKRGSNENILASKPNGNVIPKERLITRRYLFQHHVQSVIAWIFHLDIRHRHRQIRLLEFRRF
jgi:hypothetical protein